MKKHYLLAAAVATLLATGCQKDQELVTLGAEIDQPAKTYINNRYPCWNEGDEVYVNDAAYLVSAISGSSAQIADVVGSDSYRAIFPASLVTAGSNIATSATIPVTLPATQKYQVVDGHQRVDAPMGAFTDGSTLLFHNLCSILHVVVNNTSGSDMTLGSLKVEAANAMLSGTGTATVNGADDDGITLSSDASHAVSLRLSGATNVTLSAGTQSAFDIYVPAFPTDNVTITLTTTNGYYFELTKSNVALRHNTYTTVTLNVDHLTQILAAELVNGPTFNAAIPRNATAVVFEYNSSVSSGTLLSTSNSPVPIYGNLDGTTWRVSTSASVINANSDCSGLFEAYDWRSTVGHDYYFSFPSLTEIDFGDGFNTINVTNMCEMFACLPYLTYLDVSNFNTENVTNMRDMFRDCQSITNLDVSNFNTSSVTDMDWMFDGCYSLTSLDVSNFNTENVTNMAALFGDCSSLTHLDVSNFNTENVTNMAALFGGCSSLTHLDVSNFNTENVTSMNGMFLGCISLTSLDVSNFNTENVTDMTSMFGHCGSLTSLDVSNFNTTNVTEMSQMFGYCSSLTSLDLTHFYVPRGVYMSGMFYGCSSLTSLDLSNLLPHWRMSTVVTNSMFYGCSSLTSLNFSSLRASEDMRYMFAFCYNLTNLNLAHLDMSRVNSQREIDGEGVTHHVSGKKDMCNGLSTLSHTCTITCPLAAQIELENGTNLPTSGVTFTWLRPTYK